MLEAALTRNKLARISGLLYLIVVIAGILNLGYIPSQIIVRGDIAKTVANIQASETLFLIGITAGIICYTAFLVLPLFLYQLLSPVGKNAAVLMVVLALSSFPISFLNMAHQLDVLSLVRGVDGVKGWTTEQLHAQIGFLFDQYHNVIFLLKILWGLWLFPFGYLVYRSGFIPKIFGIVLMMGCFSYLMSFFTPLFLPSYPGTLIASLISIPHQLGEIGICLWLLLMGVRTSETRHKNI